MDRSKEMAGLAVRALEDKKAADPAAQTATRFRQWQTTQKKFWEEPVITPEV